MSAKLWSAATVNAFSTTLNGNITNSDTSITLTSVTGLVAPGVLVIDRQDGNDNDTPTVREYITFTGISGNQVTGCTRGVAGSTAQSHNSGATVEETMTITHWTGLLDFLAISHDVDGKIVTSNATIETIRLTSFLDASGASVAASNLRVFNSVNFSGASTLGFDPIHPVWVISGSVSQATAGIGKPLIMPKGASWNFFSAVLRTPTSGASLMIDINKNGTSIFTDQNTRLTFPINGTFISTASIEVKTFNSGDIFTIDIDAGGGLASDLTILGKAL